MMPRITETLVVQVTFDELIENNSAVNLRKMTPEARGALIHNIIQGMTEATRAIDNLWLHMGKFWSFIIKNKVYRHYGTHIRNVNDFLRELDLGVSRSNLDHYARVYNTFGRYVRENNLQIPYRKLLTVHPVVEACSAVQQREEAIQIWVDKANTLPMGALENEVRVARGLTPTDACLHPPEASQLWSRCGECGKWLELIPNPGGE
jgi:hypothetical protein